MKINVKTKSSGVLTWAEYLRELGLGTPAEVEAELRRLGNDTNTVTEYRAARYVVLGRVRDPDVNDSADGSKIVAAGWRPPTDFDAALEKTVGWYLRNTQWLELT